MPETVIPPNVDVSSAEGPFGHSVCVLFDPLLKKVTHVVVRARGSGAIERLVPIQMIEVQAPGQIAVTCTRDRFDAMEVFAESAFILADAGTPEIRMWPYVEAAPGLIVLESEKLAAVEAAIRRGDPVYANDGFVGDVGELMLDQPGGKLTHLVLREGHLWGRKDVCIPVSMIRTMGTAGVGLFISKKQIAALPAVQVCRFYPRSPLKVQFMKQPIDEK